MSDDDCEDQACSPTEVCTLFLCQTWEGDTLIRPELVLRGKYWCCSKCGVNYGEHAKGDPAIIALNDFTQPRQMRFRATSEDDLFTHRLPPRKLDI